MLKKIKNVKLILVNIRDGRHLKVMGKPTEPKCIRKKSKENEDQKT